MDVLVLIDKLDDLVHNARPVPLTDQVRVDREEIYDLLDQMRATIPEEIKQARWIVKERQEMLAEAKREAERIVREAREQQARLISDEEVTKQAERAADEIVEDARDARAGDPPRRRGLRRRDPQHPRGQPSEVPRRRAARSRPPRRPRRRAGRELDEQQSALRGRRPGIATSPLSGLSASAGADDREVAAPARSLWTARSSACQVSSALAPLEGVGFVSSTTSPITRERDWSLTRRNRSASARR